MGGAEYLDYLKLRDLNVHTAESLRRLKAKRIRHVLSLFITLQCMLAVAPGRAGVDSWAHQRMGFIGVE